MQTEEVGWKYTGEFFLGVVDSKEFGMLVMEKQGAEIVISAPCFS
ncbi:MAG: hypothetical protein WC791_02955 [Candidatus Paceibacterota bacterium]|jgi:hypothetical protein